MKTSLIITNTPETNIPLLVERAQNRRVQGNHDRGAPFTREQAREILANLALQPDPDTRALFRGLYESLKISA